MLTRGLRQSLAKGFLGIIIILSWFLQWFFSTGSDHLTWTSTLSIERKADWNDIERYISLTWSFHFNIKYPFQSPFSNFLRIKVDEGIILDFPDSHNVLDIFIIIQVGADKFKHAFDLGLGGGHQKTSHKQNLKKPNIHLNWVKRWYW